MSGFWLLEEKLGEVHITGNPNMSERTLELLTEMFNLAFSEVVESQAAEPGGEKG